jgi:hypothetical protein
MVKLPEPGNSSPVLPGGSYNVKIVSHEKTTASTGTPQILWKAEVVDGDHSGSAVSTYTALTDNAIWKVANLIGATGIGYKANALDTEASEFTQLCNLTVGRTSYWLNVEGQDNKGIPRNNIVKFEQDADQDKTDFEPTDDSPFAEDESPFVE